MSAIFVLLAVIVAFWLGGEYWKAKRAIEQVRVQAYKDFDTTRTILIRWYERQDDPDLFESAKHLLRVHNERVKNATFLPLLKAGPLDTEYLKAYKLLADKEEHDSHPLNAYGQRQKEAFDFMCARVECWQAMNSDLSASAG